MRSVVDIIDHPDHGMIQIVSLKDANYQSKGANVEPVGGGSVISHHKSIFKARTAMDKIIQHPEGTSKPEAIHAAIQANARSRGARQGKRK